MATNLVGDGNVVQYTNTGSAISAGAVVIMADTVGIALTDIAATSGVGSVAITGEWTVTKVAGTAWLQGDSIDWDASATAFQKGPTPATGDVLLCCTATAAAASGATTATVRLNPGTGTYTA